MSAVVATPPTRDAKFRVHATLPVDQGNNLAGLPIYVETRPLYLHLTRSRFTEPDAAKYVGAPPLREQADRDAKFGGEVRAFLKRAGSRRLGRVSGVLGRTESPSDGWAAAAERCWITSFRSMSDICCGWAVSTLPITSTLHNAHLAMSLKNR